MKKLLGPILLIFAVTGFSGIAKSTPISATEFQGYRVEIDQAKLDALYSRILGQPQKAPFVRFEKCPGFNDNYLALYDHENYKILFYFPNWSSSYTKDCKVFKKWVIRVLAHECGHAIGFEDQPPSPDAQLHKKIQGYIELLAPIFNPFVVLILGLIGILTLQRRRLIKIGFSMLIIIICGVALAFLLVNWRESVTDKIGNELTSQYGAEFHEIVKITKK